MSQTNPLENLYQEELYVLTSPLLIALSKPWSGLGADELNTLTRILSAVKLNLSSVQIIVRKDFSMDELSVYSPKRVLSFGVTLRSSTSLYECLTIDGVAVIISESLDKLDDAKKKTLWVALKKMFNL